MKLILIVLLLNGVKMDFLIIIAYAIGLLQGAWFAWYMLRGKNLRELTQREEK